MKVLVIPEDVRTDQYMLKPIIQAMMKKLGQSKAIAEVCQDPRLQGISQVNQKLPAILQKYKWQVDLFLVCVDRDGQPNRTAELHYLEDSLNTKLDRPGKLLLAECAWQEIEVWVLAGLDDLPSTWSWKAIREESHPKETYFYPYATSRNILNSPAQGRKILAQEAAKKYDRIRKLCPEDIGRLEDRIQAWLSQVRVG